jgi:hypothetical protein
MGERSVVEMLTVEAGSTGTRLQVSLVGEGEVLVGGEVVSGKERARITRYELQ